MKQKEEDLLNFGDTLTSKDSLLDKYHIQISLGVGNPGISTLLGILCTFE